MFKAVFGNKCFSRSGVFNARKAFKEGVLFHDSKGVVYKEFVPPGQTVNAPFSHRSTRTTSARRLPTSYHDGGSAMTTCQATSPWRPGSFWPRNISEPSHSLVYSANLSLYDFFLFPRLKRVMKGSNFQTIQAATTRYLRSILEKEFLGAYDNGKHVGNAVWRQEEPTLQIFKCKL